MVLISDFYEEPDAAFDAVSLLRGRGNDVIAFHLLDAAELRFPFEEAAEFEDLSRASASRSRPTSSARSTAS